MNPTVTESIYWAGESDDEDFICQYLDMLDEHPTIKGAYFRRDPDGGNAVDKPQPYYAYRPEPKGRFVYVGNSDAGQSDPNRESGGASSSNAGRMKKNRQQHLNFDADEFEGLSAENKELYRCLAEYSDDSD